MHKLEFKALGTTWQIQILEPIDEPQIVFNEIQKVVTEFENTYSRFRDNSLITELNIKRVLQKPPAELIQILELAQKWYKLSGGEFNILIGDYLERTGYNPELNFVENDLQKAQIGNPLTDIVLEACMIKLLGQSKIDLGGIGKGFLVDKLRDLLRFKYSIQEFVINGGGDLYFGSKKESQTFYLQHPTNPDEYIEQVQLQNQALCSSSRLERTWTSPNTKNHFSHLVDQNLNTKNQPIAQSYVITNDCVTADIIATILCLKGLDYDWIELMKQKLNQTLEIFVIVEDQLIHISNSQ
jgi:FAD:protein FMN transferase